MPRNDNIRMTLKKYAREFSFTWKLVGREMSSFFSLVRFLFFLSS